MVLYAFLHIWKKGRNIGKLGVKLSVGSHEKVNFNQPRAKNQAEAFKVSPPRFLFQLKFQLLRPIFSYCETLSIFPYHHLSFALYALHSTIANLQHSLYDISFVGSASIPRSQSQPIHTQTRPQCLKALLLLPLPLPSPPYYRPPHYSSLLTRKILCAILNYVRLQLLPQGIT